MAFTSSAFTTACAAGYTAGNGIQLTFVARYGDLDDVQLRSSYGLVRDNDNDDDDNDDAAAAAAAAADDDDDDTHCFFRECFFPCCC